jgi:GntR family transcriptional regulator
MLLIDKFSTKPVYEQLIEGIERDILVGAFAEGAQLPSLRELSAMLSINPNTIQKSYAELTRRGIILPAHGSGCYVSPDAREILRREAAKRLEEMRQLARQLSLAGVQLEDMIDAVKQGADRTREKTNKEDITNDCCQ